MTATKAAKAARLRAQAECKAKRQAKEKALGRTRKSVYATDEEWQVMLGCLEQLRAMDEDMGEKNG